jgi:hypothetical protein
MQSPPALSRRRFLSVAGGAWVNIAIAETLLADAVSPRTVLNPPLAPGVTLANAPIELAGDWTGMNPADPQRVIERARLACLDGVRLVSDRQPTRLRVDRHLSGAPAVWLHPGGSPTAWVIVDTAERAWIQLAYQFGHELGHVFANSWLAHAAPKRPTQWLEEAVAEAFALRGLGRLGNSWKARPPFPNDNAYGDAILRYRQDVIDKYVRLGQEQGGVEDLKAWFERNRTGVETSGVLPFDGVAGLYILAQFDKAPECVEAIGALNRWPGRTSLPLPDYLRQWEASCQELGASPILPVALRRTLLGR